MIVYILNKIKLNYNHYFALSQRTKTIFGYYIMVPSNSFFLCYCNYVRAEDPFVHLNVINRQRQRQQNRKANYMPGPNTRTP